MSEVQRYKTEEGGYEDETGRGRLLPDDEYVLAKDYDEQVFAAVAYEGAVQLKAVKITALEAELEDLRQLKEAAERYNENPTGFMFECLQGALKECRNSIAARKENEGPVK